MRTGMGMGKLFNILALLGVLSAIVFSVGCARVGELQRERRTVERGGAGSATVTLVMGAGRLQLAGGARALLDADFAYNVAAWQPRVEYGVDGGRGSLAMRQGSSRGGPLDLQARNEWDLRLSDDLPIDLRVELGAGRGELRLDGLQLAGLDVQTGAGAAIVDLTGARVRDLHATIEGGAGEITVRLPRDIGARVEVHKGIGEVRADGLRGQGAAWVNDAWGTTAATLQLTVEAGVGTVTLELAD